MIRFRLCSRIKRIEVIDILYLKYSFGITDNFHSINIFIHFPFPGEKHVVIKEINKAYNHLTVGKYLPLTY